MYDVTPTICMVKYALCMTSHPRFMTSQLSIHDIKDTMSHITPFISDTTSTVSLSSHPDYRSHNPHCLYNIRATICMTSIELHMTSHPLFMISHHSMTSHPLYSCHHTQYTWHRTHCSSAMTYSVWIIPHLQYVWHQGHYMYDIIWILYDIIPTLYDITRQYTWHHIHSIHAITPTLHDITYIILVTSQPLYLWKDMYYVYDINVSTCDISQGVWMTTQPL